MQRLLLGASSRSLALLVLSLCWPTQTGAQATTASVEGIVRSVDGTPLNGAQVEIKSRETGAYRGTVSDRAGSYHVYGLSPGAYDVVARAIGYRPERRDSIEIVVDEGSRVDFALAVNN